MKQAVNVLGRLLTKENGNAATNAAVTAASVVRASMQVGNAFGSNSGGGYSSNNNYNNSNNNRGGTGVPPHIALPVGILVLGAGIVGLTLNERRAVKQDILRAKAMLACQVRATKLNCTLSRLCAFDWHATPRGEGAGRLGGRGLGRLAGRGPPLARARRPVRGLAHRP